MNNWLSIASRGRIPNVSTAHQKMGLSILLGLAIIAAMIGPGAAGPVYGASPGDIAIIGVRADDIDGTPDNGNDDAFAWVVLVDLAAGAEIFFTDAGWTDGNSFRGLEGAIKYTAPAGGLAAGTVMLLEFTNSSGNYLFTPSGGGGTYSDADDAIVGISGLLPATPGDNLFIFEGSTASPSFIWGWKNEGPFDADSTSNDTTALPSGLSVGINAVSVGGGFSTDNNRYVGPSTGIDIVLADAIANPANWEATDTLPFPSGGFDITNGTLGSGDFTVFGVSTPTPTYGPTDTPTPIPPTPTDTPTPVPPTPTPTDTPTPIPPTPTDTVTPTPIPPTPTDTVTPTPIPPTPTDTPTPIPPTPTDTVTPTPIPPTPTDTPTPIPPTPTNTVTPTPIPPTPTDTVTPTPIPPTPTNTVTPTPVPPTPTPTPTATPGVPPVADAGGPYLAAVDETIPLDGSGTDADGGTLSYLWSTDEPGSSFSDDTAADSDYTAGPEAGIFELTLTVTDSGGLSDTDTAMLVVYDPSAGFVTGGGWIDSPAGAYKPDDDAIGKATFGFVSKYKKGKNRPDGNTQFQFQAGDLNFHSDSYEWLVVTGSDYAMFNGEGTVNGDVADSGNLYKFRIWAGDGDLAAGPDTFRIKIWDEVGDIEFVLYDNGANQALGGGSIVVHTKKK